MKIHFTKSVGLHSINEVNGACHSREILQSAAFKKLPNKRNWSCFIITDLA